MCNFRILKGLHILRDILAPIHQYQKFIQAKNTNIVEVSENLSILLAQLNLLKTVDFETLFDEKFNENLSTFGEIPIKVTSHMPNQVQNFKTDYLNSVIADLKERTAEIVEELKNFDILTKIENMTDQNVIQQKCRTLARRFPSLKIDSVRLCCEVVSFERFIWKIKVL